MKMLDFPVKNPKLISFCKCSGPTIFRFIYTSLNRDSYYLAQICSARHRACYDTCVEKEWAIMSGIEIDADYSVSELKYWLPCWHRE